MVKSYFFKIIVVGDGGVGKTTMVKRLCFGKFIPQKITIGTDLAMYDLILNDTIYKLQLWDFAGEKRFRFFLPSYCRGADACIFVFDLTRYQSFPSLQEWYDIVTQNTENLATLLVGSKLDLAIDMRQITSEEAIEFQKAHNVDAYIETSSKSGENNRQVFEMITLKIVEKRQLQI